MKKITTALIFLSLFAINITTSHASMFGDFISTDNFLDQGEFVTDFSDDRVGNDFEILDVFRLRPTPTLCFPGMSPSIRVITPQGGEVYTLGQQITVRWISCNVPPGSVATYSLLYNTNPIKGWTTTNIPISQGSLQYIFPTDIPTGTGYTMGIGVLPSMSNIYSVWNESEYFAINGQTLPAGCTSNLGYSPTTGMYCNYPGSIVAFPYGCSSANGFSSTTGQSCNWTNYSNGCSSLGGYSATTGQFCSSAGVDITPRIAYWYGKVNQYVDSQGNWQTDPDGTSGANLDQYMYCKKWYPNTITIAIFKNETITTWRAAGNTGQYMNTVMTVRCVK